GIARRGRREELAEAGGRLDVVGDQPVLGVGKLMASVTEAVGNALEIGTEVVEAQYRGLRHSTGARSDRRPRRRHREDGGGWGQRRSRIGNAGATLQHAVDGVVD